MAQAWVSAADTEARRGAPFTGIGLRAKGPVAKMLASQSSGVSVPSWPNQPAPQQRARASGVEGAGVAVACGYCGCCECALGPVRGLGGGARRGEGEQRRRETGEGQAEAGRAGHALRTGGGRGQSPLIIC